MKRQFRNLMLFSLILFIPCSCRVFHNESSHSSFDPALKRDQVYSYEVKSWHEIAKRESLTDRINKKTLVLLDLDNTLLKEKTFIGSPYWFDWQVEQIRNNTEYRIADNMKAFLALNEFVLRLSPMQLTETVTPQVIREWQKKGAAIMVVTARPSSVSYATQRALDENGFDIKGVPGILDFTHPHLVAYHDGVFYLAGSNKATQMQQWFDVSGVKQGRWSHLIMVDDTASNLGDMKHVDWASFGIRRLDLFHYQKLTQNDYPLSLSGNLQKLKQLDADVKALYERLYQ